MRMEALRRLPVWKNRLILATPESNAPQNSCENETQTKKKYEVYREPRFLNFNNFPTSDNTVKASGELRGAVDAKLIGRALTKNVFMARSFSDITKSIGEIWSYAKEHLLSTSADRLENRGSLKWTWKTEVTPNFTQIASRTGLWTLIERPTKTSSISRSLRVYMHRTMNTSLRAESHTHAWLFQSRKHPLMRLQRNGLCVRVNRNKWEEEY